MADTLEEHGEVETEPGCTQVETIAETGLAVADDLPVTAVAHLSVTSVNDTVAVQVGELQVTGTYAGGARNGVDVTRALVDDAVHIGLVHLGRPFGGSLVAGEEPHDVVTPDVTVVHALPVVLGKELVGVVEAGSSQP